MFSNVAGTVTTSTAKLTVAAAKPVVTTQATDQTVGSGGTASFTADATGDPTPTVQWQVSTDKGVTFTDIASATDPMLQVRGVKTTDTGNSYRAVFSNAGGTDTTTTASLVVNPAAPTITTDAKDQTVDPGASVTFTADATGDPTPTVQWQRSTDGGAIYTNIAGETSKSYTFTAARADDQNVYRAVFSNAGGTNDSAGATLTVNPVKPVVPTNLDSQFVIDGTQVTFSADATGDPTPTVEWLVSVDNGGSFTDVAGATSRSYTFTATRSLDGNLYRAVFTNSGGTATTNVARLTVETPPQVTKQPRDVTIDEGQTATFTAAAEGRPTPTVQWQVSTNGNTNFVDVNGATASSYTTGATTARDNQNVYRAVFTNSVGRSATNAAKLTVNSPPQVTTQPAGQTVNEGMTASFTAGASRFGGAPTVQWQRSTGNGATFTNVAGATVGTYTTGPTVAADGRDLYRAVFTNAFGSTTTRAATLTVIATPISKRAPSAPQNVKATQTGPGQITVTWDPPADSGTAPVSSYDVGYGNGRFGNGGSFPATARKAVFNGLANGAYQASVGAISADGTGPRVFTPVTVTSGGTTPPGTTPPGTTPPGGTTPPTGQATSNDLTVATPTNQPVRIDVGASPGSVVVLTALPIYGRAILNPDGSVVYTPTVGYRGIDLFGYRVTTRSGAVTAGTVTVRVGQLAFSGADTAGQASVALGMLGFGGLLAFAGRRRRSSRA